MDIEESIKVLDEIAEGFENLSAEVCARNDLIALWAGRAKGIRQAIAVINAHLRVQPNDPLTLEELREMDGEPVWVVELNGYPPHWGLVYWCRKNKRNIVYVTINNGASICAETLMAAGGKIYRRKPEEVAYE